MFNARSSLSVGNVAILCEIYTERFRWLLLCTRSFFFVMRLNQMFANIFDYPCVTGGA